MFISKKTPISGFLVLFLLFSATLCGACASSTDDAGHVEADLLGITSDNVGLMFRCGVDYTADIEASEEGKNTSVLAYLNEAALGATLKLTSAELFVDEATLALKIQEFMTNRVERAPSTMGLFTFHVTCGEPRRS